MATNISRRISWILIGLCLPVLARAATSEVSKFIASEERAYLEMTVDRAPHKIYTEYHGDYKAMFVFGEWDNPELLKVSYVDSSKTITTFILEFRTEKGRVSPGLQVADNAFIQSLKSDAKGFDDWQKRFSSFPLEATDHRLLTDPAFADPGPLKLVDGDEIVFRASDMFCVCNRYGAAVTYCKDPNVQCAYNGLCKAWQCIEAGEWGPECQDALDEAKQCLELMKQ